MALRITQSYISVLGDVDPAGDDRTGNCRITQCYISILGSVPPLEDEAEDEITLFEEIVAATGYNRSVSDTIALNETASRGAGGDDDIDLDETINLSHGRSVFDTMSLDESINFSYTEDVSDDIDLTERASRVHFLGDTISMSDASLKIFTATDIIDLTETLFNSDHVYVTDTISISDEAEQEPTPGDTIQLFETTDYNWSGDRDGDDDIGLFETIHYVVNSDCPTCCDPDEDYRPYVGVTSDPSLPEPPGTEAPTLTQSHSVVISYPFNTPTTTVTLRAPDFGNQESVSNTRIHRESRGGTLIIFADTQWPKTKRLTMEFSVLTEEVAQDYLDFRAASLGKLIRLVDHESRTWQGVLVETDTPITRKLRACGVTASLTFEGELV